MIPIRRKFCSRSCHWTAEIEFSNAELKAKILAVFNTLGRTPSKRELGRIAYKSIRVFGSWNKSLREAGLTPLRSHDKRMYTRMGTTAIDGHKCDSISEAIIDNWLTKHKILHTRHAPYPTTHHKAYWCIGDKIFIEYFGLANDCRRYDRTIREKRKLCKKHGTHLVELQSKGLISRSQSGGKIPEVAD